MFFEAIPFTRNNYNSYFYGEKNLMLPFLSLIVFISGIISLITIILKINKNPSLKSGSTLILLYVSLAALVIVFSLNLVNSNEISQEIDSLKIQTKRLETVRDSLKTKLNSTQANFTTAANNLDQFNKTVALPPLKIRLQQLLDKINLEIIPMLKNDNAACVFINQANLNSLLEMKDSLAIQNILRIAPTDNTLISNKEHSSNF
jgi:hypothetical protein